MSARDDVLSEGRSASHHVFSDNVLSHFVDDRHEDGSHAVADDGPDCPQFVNDLNLPPPSLE